MGKVEVSNDELRAIRDAMRELNRMIDALESADSEKFVLLPKQPDARRRYLARDLRDRDLREAPRRGRRGRTTPGRPTDSPPARSSNASAPSSLTRNGHQRAKLAWFAQAPLDELFQL